MTDNILDPNSIKGQFGICSGEQCFGQLRGGQIPNYDPQAQTVYWGYGGGILNWTYAVNQALKEQGLNVIGYNYQWYVKNYDANRSQNDGDDYLRISVRILDESGKEVFGKQYNLDGYYNWTYFNGQEIFKDPLIGSDLSEVVIRAEGDDVGYWAGWYGPEFDVGRSSVNLLYAYMPTEEEELDCADPLSNPLCPGYSTALMEQQNELLDAIASGNTGENSSLTQDDDVAFVENVTSTVEENNQQEEINNGETNQTPETEPQVAEANSVGQEEQSSQDSAENDSGTSVERVDGLAIAQTAVGNALSNAQNTINSTLSSTTASVTSATNFAMDSMESQQQQMQSSTDSFGDSNNTQSNSNSTSGVNPSTGSIDPIMLATESSSSFNNQSQEEQQLSVGEEVIIEITVTDTLELASLDTSVLNALNNILEMESDIAEESSEESFEEQNAKEDELVNKALSGDNGEDAQAALLGYNPQFREYQQPQLPDSQFYDPKEIYEGQKNWDNPNSRFFNGASDSLHKQMVRSQYDQ